MIHKFIQFLNPFDIRDDKKEKLRASHYESAEGHLFDTAFKLVLYALPNLAGCHFDRNLSDTDCF